MLKKLCRPFTEEEQAQIVAKNLAKSLCAIAHDEMRITAALEWASESQIESALLLMPSKVAEKIQRKRGRGC